MISYMIFIIDNVFDFVMNWIFKVSASHIVFILFFHWDWKKQLHGLYSVIILSMFSMSDDNHARFR